MPRSGLGSAPSGMATTGSDPPVVRSARCSSVCCRSRPPAIHSPQATDPTTAEARTSQPIRRFTISCLELERVIVGPQVVMRLRRPNESAMREQLDPLLPAQAIAVFGGDLLPAEVVLPIDVVIQLSAHAVVPAKVGAPLGVAAPAVREVLVRAVLPPVRPVQCG